MPCRSGHGRVSPGASSGLGGEWHRGPGGAPLRGAPVMPGELQSRLLASQRR